MCKSVTMTGGGPDSSVSDTCCVGCVGVTALCGLFLLLFLLRVIVGGAGVLTPRSGVSC